MVAEVGAIVTRSSVIATQITNSNSNHMGNNRVLSLKLRLKRNPMLKVLLAVKTCTQPTVATRTTLPSGCPTGRSKANKLEDSHRPVDKHHLASETAYTPPIYRL